MTRMYASCLIWLEYRHLFYWTVQVRKDKLIVNTLFHVMSLKRVVAQEIITCSGPFGSLLAVHVLNSSYDGFRPIPSFGDSCSSTEIQP